MYEAVSYQCIAVMDEESDKKCASMVAQMMMSGNLEMAETILR